MPRFSSGYGEMVRRRLDTLRWSNREASARTGGALSHTLIREIRTHGYVPNAEQVVELAIAMGEDPNKHLDIAGKPSHLRYVGELTAARVRRRVAVDVRSAAGALG